MGALGLWALGCGGQAVGERREADPPGDASSGGAPAADSGAGGAFLFSPQGPGGSSSLPSALCAAVHPACGTTGFVDVHAPGGSTRLSYPLGGAECHRCDADGCELWIGFRGCSRAVPLVGACAGPSGTPPCLDTASATPAYTDATGKVWSVRLDGYTLVPGDAGAGSAVREIEAALVLSDGQTEETVSIRVRACTDVFSAFAIPC